MNRIDTRFAELKKENRAGLIPFIMGYDPDAKTSLALLKEIVSSGADIVEIGMPFSDPMADGAVIQAAGLRALAAGATLKGILQLVTDFRKTDADTPIILMGYYNPIYRYGAEAFCRDAKSAGADGIILVDLPPEEEREFTVHAKAYGISFIRLIAPTSLDTRLPMLCGSAESMVYYISVAGITGARAAEAGQLADDIKRIRVATSLPVAVGFGIKTPEQAKTVAGVANAVVVGSALVDAIAKADDKVKAAGEFVGALSKAIIPSPHRGEG